MSNELAPPIVRPETLAILRKAAALVPRDRVIAASDAPSPGEGLALLSAYLRIADAGQRQTILDAVVAMAGTRRI